MVAYLQQPHLIEGFNPGATPPHTAAWHEVAAANVNPQDNKLADLLDTMGPDADWLDEPIRPDAVTIEQITSARGCPSEIAEFFSDHKKARQWPHRLEVAGYSMARNPDRGDGLWRVAGRRINHLCEAGIRTCRG